MRIAATALFSACLLCASLSAGAMAPLADCSPEPAPIIAAPPMSASSQSFAISWDGDLTKTPRFELQEATSESFGDAITIAVDGALTTTIAAHPGVSTDTRFYYRVRGFAACSGEAGPYSRVGSTIVNGTPSSTGTEFSISIPAGTTLPFVQDYLVPGFGETATIDDRFLIVVDAPWLSAFPFDGALSAGGTTVQFTIDPTKAATGTSRATISLKRTQPSGSAASSIPITLSLAPAVRLLPRLTPLPAGTRVIPGVAHADGFSARFQSDLRLRNAGGESVTYELSYTPTESNGTVSGKKMSIDVASNETKALDDVVKRFFGAGLLGERGIGTLEIRPIRTSSGGEPEASATFASSRTYSVTSAGSFGQFIPALSSEWFIGNVASDPLARISLQQIASSAAYRTNVGFVERAGAPAQLNLKLFDASGKLLQQIPFSLAPLEHRQVNLSAPALFAGVSIDDARLEAEVTSATGLVTAYASVIDNETSDPSFISPMIAGRHLVSRTVLPGVAEASGSKNLHTAMRAYNAGPVPVTVTLSYRPKTGDATPAPVQLTTVLDGNEVLVNDDVLPSLWGFDNTSGALTLTTAAPTALVVTARTFSRTASGGTVGQFISGARPSDAVGAGERALEVLQLEHSSTFASDLAIFEVTGNPATVEISGYASNSSATGVMALDLSGGEFRQLDSVFTQLGLTTVYDGRVSVRVVSGAGRASAYGSVVDLGTGDPTYIPGQ